MVAAVALILMLPPVVALVLFLVGTAMLGRKVRRVRAEVADDFLVIDNRWLTHRIPVGAIESLTWSRLGLGVGPTVVSVRTRDRLSALYPLTKVTVEATATFDVDEMNQGRRTLARWLPAAADDD
jgi:hypothetical protein